MTTNGQIEVIVSFNADTGMWPTGLSRGIDGNFYGTTSVQGGLYCNGAVFRLVQVPESAVNAPSNAVVGLTWNAFTNGVYQVECTTSMTDPDWIPLGDPITAITNSVSISDAASSSSRFIEYLCYLGPSDEILSLSKVGPTLPLRSGGEIIA